MANNGKGIRIRFALTYLFTYIKFSEIIGCEDYKKVFQCMPICSHIMYSRYLSRFFDCLAHPNLSATLATDQKRPLTLIGMNYESKKKAHL